MHNTKSLRVILFCWLIILLYYYMIYCRSNIDFLKPIQMEILKKRHQNRNGGYINVSNDFLIDTPGCSIPNYIKTLRIKEADIIKKSTCGQRAVFVNKISNDEIVFLIDAVKMRVYTKEKYSCCYQFVGPSTVANEVDYTKLRYSSCNNFTNNYTGKLVQEIITVTCTENAHKKRVIYEDAYAILKKLTKNGVPREKYKSWNVLILGMDTMSRARIYSSMPESVKYMLQNGWLDYRGFQKVGYNTLPNVMSLLTGKNLSAVYKACASGMDNCNKFMIWSEFKKAGYVTATGEDYLKLPDTFSNFGYKNSPTDHYLRPLFLTGERFNGNLVCTKKLTSVRHMLDYATTFADTYKWEKFFGMFWFNSYSHNLINVPTLVDKDIVDFFKQLDKNGVLNNTFIFFLSDHGIRAGSMRVPYESYYEERLPMLFLWIPREFHSNVIEYNMKLNQYRLTTQYDLYLTLYDIMAISLNVSASIKSEACPNCLSIFNEISEYRTCADTVVTEKWCTCREMIEVSHDNTDVVVATQIAVNNLQERIKKIKAIQCMTCEVLKLKKVLRTHMSRDESGNGTYYVLAFVMSPGDVAYEATLVKNNETFNLILPTYTISIYNTRGNCVINSIERPYCVCKKIHKCKEKR